jgi:nucleoside-diphosphate-sugar epimerase
MNILITGGLGLIGHNVANKLENLGHNVVITDTETTYGIIPKDEIEYLMSERRKKIKTNKIYKFDILDQTNIEWLFSGFRFDTVIHMASFPRQKVVNSNPKHGSKIMCEGLINLLEASKKYNAKKFVYISSSMVYGDFTNDVTEEYNCKPQGQYGILKLTGEHLLKDYTRRGCFDHVIIRPSAVYGPLDVEDRVIAKFLLTAMRGGVLKVNGATETLDFTYVDDAAEGIVAASLSNNTINKTYNITKSHSRSLLYAAELAIKIVGRGSIEVKEKDVDFPSRGSLNISKARQDFNFNPKVDVEEGFQKYSEWLNNSIYWKTQLSK